MAILESPRISRISRLATILRSLTRVGQVAAECDRKQDGKNKADCQEGDDINHLNSYVC